jgi:hypothetical protein
MEMVRAGLKGGTDGSSAGAVTENCYIIFYGPERGKENVYVRNGEIDERGRVIFDFICNREDEDHEAKVNAALDRTVVKELRERFEI